MPKFFLFFIFYFCIININAQVKFTKNNSPLNSQKTERYSVNGIFDTLYDQLGVKYNLADLIIKQNPLSKTFISETGTIQAESAFSFTSCNSGYFKLYFEIGSGMEGNSVLEQERRDVICQVFSDLAQFINSPLTSNGGKVNIFIRDIINMGVSTPSSSGVGGVASSFFSIPAIQNIGGVADNLIWQTIVSGTDAYVNVSNPLCTPLVAGGNYYHGMLSINFADPTLAWHTQLSSPPTSNELDLYTVALHEITHAIGFGSLINQNGQSKMGPTFPYYSRFDTYLKTQNNVPLIAQSTSSCNNSHYSLNWNSLVSQSVLQPGFTNTNSCTYDNTICSAAIIFSGSVVQPVYTPDCFTDASSLSHFEDQCAPSTPGNNLYFVMSNASNTGPAFMKRYFKPEERSALCDIGYSCGTSYGNAGNLNNYVYSGSTCLGAEVAGINDGLTSLNSYAFIGIVNSGIPITNILANDHFTTGNNNTFKCLEVISGSGNFSNTFGISCTYTPTSSGFHLLRYIPLDGATGKEGNITYVYVFAQSSNCTPNSCDLVNNGGFENATLCGQIDYGTSCSVNCWNLIVGTPDLFVRGCLSGNGLWTTVPTPFCLPPSDTWNNGANGNNSFLGMATTDNLNNNSEGAQTQLSSDLMPNTLYNLSFWAKVADNFNGSPGGNIAHLIFAGAPSVLTGSPSAVTSSLPSGLTQLAYVPVPNNYKWNYFSIPISFTTATPFSYLSIVNASWLTNLGGFVFIDDVSIKPALNTPTFTSPAPICQNQKITNLNNYVSMPGGTFSGSGISLNSTTGYYEFNSLFNTPSGNHLIAFNYTLNNCASTLLQTIAVIGSSITSPPNYICKGDSVALTASGANSYTWNTGSTYPTIVVSPTTTTIFTVNTGSSSTNSCAISTQTVIVTVLYAGTSVTPISQTICAGSPANLIASMPNIWSTVYWNTNSSSYSISVFPTVTTSYNVTGYNGENGCSSDKYATVHVSQATATVNPPSQIICNGETVQLFAGGSSTYSWSTGVTNSSISVSPTSNTYYTLHGYESGSCHTYTFILIQVKTCTGLDPLFNKDDLRIYPNPTSNQLFIETFTLPVTITVYDATGRKIIHKIFNEPNPTLEMDSYSKGIYLIRISSSYSTSEMKIIKID